MRYITGAPFANPDSLAAHHVVNINEVIVRCHRQVFTLTCLETKHNRVAVVCKNVNYECKISPWSFKGLQALGAVLQHFGLWFETMPFTEFNTSSIAAF